MLRGRKLGIQFALSFGTATEFAPLTPTSSLPDFKVKASPEREGRNPATGEKMTVAASKKLTFAPAKALKDALNK